jgi:hypothetical protein
MAALEKAVRGKSILTLPAGEKEEWKNKAELVLEHFHENSPGNLGLEGLTLPSNLRFAIGPFPRKKVLLRLLAEYRVGLITEAQVGLVCEKVRILFEEGIRGYETPELRKAREEREDQAVENMKREVARAYMSNPKVDAV